jgi:probable rRNA maturation factor
MNTPTHNIQVHFDVEVENADFDMPRLESLIRAICIEFELVSAEISIGIVNDEGISRAHKTYLGRDHTTDVISFDLSDEFESQRVFQLILNHQMAQRQALQRGHSTEAELALYITHGMLHNLGFDDLDDAQAQAMHKAEDTILQANGFGVVYGSDRKSD